MLQSVGSGRVRRDLATEQGQRGVSSVSPPVCGSGMLTQLSDSQASPLCSALLPAPSGQPPLSSWDPDHTTAGSVARATF